MDSRKPVVDSPNRLKKSLSRRDKADIINSVIGTAILATGCMVGVTILATGMVVGMPAAAALTSISVAGAGSMFIASHFTKKINTPRKNTMAAVALATSVVLSPLSLMAFNNNDFRNEVKSSLSDMEDKLQDTFNKSSANSYNLVGQNSYQNNNPTQSSAPVTIASSRTNITYTQP